MAAWEKDAVNIPQWTPVETITAVSKNGVTNDTTGPATPPRT